MRTQKDFNTKNIKQLIYWKIVLLASIHCIYIVHTLNNYYPPEVEVVEFTVNRILTIEEKIIATFPEQPELMLAIAKAESNLNPEAYNPEGHRGCRGSIGLMQIACLHTDDPEKLFDVDYNLAKAREIYDRDGLTPWGVYTNGSYLAYLE